MSAFRRCTLCLSPLKFAFSNIANKISNGACANLKWDIGYISGVSTSCRSCTMNFSPYKKFVLRSDKELRLREIKTKNETSVVASRPKGGVLGSLERQAGPPLSKKHTAQRYVLTPLVFRGMSPSRNVHVCAFCSRRTLQTTSDTGPAGNQQRHGPLA